MLDHTGNDSRLALASAYETLQADGSFYRLRHEEARFRCEGPGIVKRWALKPGKPLR